MFPFFSLAHSASLVARAKAPVALVEVVKYVGSCAEWDCDIKRGYWVRTVNGLPFTTIRQRGWDDWLDMHNFSVECVVDRRKLWPLDDPGVVIEMRKPGVSSSKHVPWGPRALPSAPFILGIKLNA